MARAVTAASNSSVTSVVQLIRGEISALMIRASDELNIVAEDCNVLSVGVLT